MKRTTLKGIPAKLALGLLAVAAAAAPSFAAELAAVQATATMPDGSPSIAMWGFIEVADAATFNCATALPSDPWVVGPTLTATDGGGLTVNLKNCLTDDPVSIFIPGQLKATVPLMFTDGQGRSRVRSFDAETAPAAVGSYTWPNVKEGTYLYHSGTHVQVQVQMGLYGALVVTGLDYPPVAQDEVLVYSEIDPALHAAVDGETYGTPAYPSTFDYKPRYFLINGAAYPDGTDIAVDTSTDVLLRFVNAGLTTHVPTLEGGLYMSLIAEDGNLYPFPMEQYGVELQAAKTIDAVVNVGADGSYALYDRALGLTNWFDTGGGMLTYIQAGAVAGAPTAVDDAYATAEGVALIVDATDDPAPPVGVLFNDTDPESDPLSAVLVSGPSAGTLECVLGDDPNVCANGSFTYTPNAFFNGTDSFTYVANDGVLDSNLATVTITVTGVNNGPVAVADAYDAEEGTTLSVAAPGVLGNDSDVDGDALTATAVGAPPPGVLALNPDGSFDYTPAGIAGTVEVFDYDACDPEPLCSTATVTINVVPAAANVPPTANDDYATVIRNSTDNIINVTNNDEDTDGIIDVATVVITTGPNTQMGGTVSANPDGTVTFTPRRGFRGSDVFQYEVNDNEGATSNVATVRVDVVRPGMMPPQQQEPPPLGGGQSGVSDKE